ncbi:integrase core domain protein [Caedimonas varicaedens]|nr:integrase core domain protein [Caedimonas varicaedens]
MKTVILARDAYGLGKHRFNSGMLDFAKHHGFQLKVCRPYRAKTKGKVERFNRYLRYSFYNPLASRLKSAGLTLDVQTANMEVLKWLKETANQRVHGTTKEVPLERLERERSTLQPLGLPYRGDVSLARCVKEPEIKAPEWAPHNPLQHPLSVYDRILEAA